MPQNQSKRMLAFALSGIVLAVLPLLSAAPWGTPGFAPGLRIAVHHAGAGPEHRGRLRWPAGPGLYRLLRRGRLHLALLNSPHLSIFMPWWFILPLAPFWLPSSASCWHASVAPAR